MSGLFATLRDLVPIFGEIPAASGPEVLPLGFQFDPFEISILLGGALLDVAVAIEFLAFLEHGREHENDLRPLAWVRYVILGFNMIFMGNISQNKVPRIGRLVRKSIAIPLLGMLGSLAYYDLVISQVGSDVWMYVFLHWFGALFLFFGVGAALFPLVVGPVVYVHTIRRAVDALRGS